LLPDVDTSARDREDQALILQDPDSPGDDVLAHVVGLLECPVGGQGATGPLPRGYPAPDDVRELEIRGNRAPMINCHSCKVRQVRIALACGYPYRVLSYLAMACLARLSFGTCRHRNSSRGATGS